MIQQSELTAAFLRERHRFASSFDDSPDTVIIDCRSEGRLVVCKGPADPEELHPAVEYRFLGRWTEYKNRRSGMVERQFQFDSFCLVEPHSREAIIAYLLRHGSTTGGFGRARATRLYEVFGQEAVRVARTDPAAVVEAVRSVRGHLYSLESAQQLAVELRRSAATEGALLDLTTLLAGRGFLRSTPQAAIREWGERAAQVVRRNPYLMMKRLRGCGFRKCDKLYLELGKNPARLKRQALCAWYAIAASTEGHTWLPERIATGGVLRDVGGADVDPPRALRLAIRGGILAERHTTGAAGPLTEPEDSQEGSVRWLAEQGKAEHEQQIAEAAAAAMDATSSLWPNAESIKAILGISDHQGDALNRAFAAGPWAILGGGPGTGKTYTAAKLLESLLAHGVVGESDVRIGAPTGKAAVRLTEALRAAGLPTSLICRTWHSHLAELESQDAEQWGQRLYVSDETSMVDADLFAAVVRALPLGAHLLLIGDVHQLPPVGHGAPLRDLIAAGLPYGELTEIRRNSGMIVSACHAIRQGRRYPTLADLESVNLAPDATSGEPRNLVRLPARHADATRDAILQVLRWAERQPQPGNEAPSGKSLNIKKDVQILAAVNEKSELSRKELNRWLQGVLNPAPADAGRAAGASGTPRLGDKVVNGKNGRFRIVRAMDRDAAESWRKAGQRRDEPAEQYVANGELGEVVGVEDRSLLIRLEISGVTIRAPRGRGDEEAALSGMNGADGANGEDAAGAGAGAASTWELGYCLSVHKSQGSEWPVAVVVLDPYPGAKLVCSREWLYTGLSRGKLLSVEIGLEETAAAMTRRVVLPQRKTLLREVIVQQRARAQLECLV